MEHLLRIALAESRAKALNLTLSGICRRAGVPAASISRWKNQKNGPLLRNLNCSMNKIEAALDAEEARIRQVLPPEKSGKDEAA